MHLRPRVSICDTENGGHRNWSELPVDEWDRIIELYDRRDAPALALEAQRLGTSVSTLERQIRQAKLHRDRYASRFLAGAIPSSRSPIHDNFTVVPTDSAILISDVEVPDYSAFMLKAALLAGIRHGIRTCVIAGDVVATDQDALNSWFATWRDESEKTYSADLDDLREILRAYSEWFKEGIYGCVGNHDLRVARATGGQITLDMLIDDTPLQLGDYSYLYLFDPTLREWTYVCHQFNYSKTPVKLAQDIWAVVTAPDGYDNETGERIPNYDPDVHGPNKAKCNVVITHTHIAQHGYSPDDNWDCIGMGCMRDQKRTRYTQARATKYPRWNNAFVMIKNGHFRTFTRKHTDWKTELGDDLYAVLMERTP